MFETSHRLRRHSVVLSAAFALVAALTTATQADAVGNGFDPHAGPVTIPGTSTVVNEWKLAGQGFAQGIQIAPQWIIASGHAPARAGSTFTNEYGSATVDRLVGVCATQFSGCDISVSHPSTPIPAPGFPPLLVNGLSDQLGVPDLPNLVPAGDTLAVGNGGSTLGRPTAAWTQPTPAGIALTTFQNGSASINGDSGGPAFYYYPGARTGVLQGLMTTASYGIAGGLQQFSAARVKPFLDNALPAGTVNWVTPRQLGSPLYRPVSVANPTATATADSVTLSWSPVAATPAVTGYRAVLVRTDNVRDARTVSVDSGQLTATFTGLPAGVAFGAFVLASNANGESGVPSATVDTTTTPSTATFATTVAAGPPPPALTNLSVTTTRGHQLLVNYGLAPGAVPQVTAVDIQVSRCLDAACATTALFAAPTASASPAVIGLLANEPRGTRYVVKARERNTGGVSPWVSTIATYAPLLAPLSPTSVTITPRPDGTATVTFVPARPEPTDLVLTGYQQHAPADRYEVRLHEPGAPSPETVDIVAPGGQGTVDVAAFGFPAGTYTVDVVADSDQWGNSAPVPVTSPLGTVAPNPPAPVTAVRNPLPPRQPANLVVPTVANRNATNTITWTQPASGPGVATPDEYLIIMTANDSNDPPIVAEVPATQFSYQYRVGFRHLYTVDVYALSQPAGASTPATGTGTDLNG